MAAQRLQKGGGDISELSGLPSGMAPSDVTTMGKGHVLESMAADKHCPGKTYVQIHQH